MKHRVSIRRSPRRTAAGFSLIELLVTMFIASVMMTAMTGFFRATVATRYDMGLQTEAQQGLRALMEMVTQELRQAGACLPRSGDFIALDGSDGGTQDSLTLRIGRTDQATFVCSQAGTTAAAPAGSTTLTVAAADAPLFADATLVYVTPNGTNGNFYTAAAVSGTTITLNEGLIGDHPAGAGIYAVDERTYAIDPSTYGRPVLTVAIDGGAPQPLVDGAEEFDLQYLGEPCTTAGCTPLSQPVTNTDWLGVREVTIAATVRSRKADKAGELASESGEVSVKPRNLL